MQLHQLKTIFHRSGKKRIGRGGKKGTYSGRGVKGQKARSGKKPRLGFAGGDTPLAMKFPKKRGVVGKVKIRRGQKIQRYRIKPVSLNLKDINKAFKSGEAVTPKSLLKKGLIDKIKGRIPSVKILAQGELKKQLRFSGVKLSKAARQKVESVKDKVVKKTVKKPSKK